MQLDEVATYDEYMRQKAEQKAAQKGKKTKDEIETERLLEWNSKWVELKTNAQSAATVRVISVTACSHCLVSVQPLPLGEASNRARSRSAH